MTDGGDSSGEFQSDKKLKDYYQSCANESLREKIGVKPLQKALSLLHKIGMKYAIKTQGRNYPTIGLLLP